MKNRLDFKLPQKLLYCRKFDLIKQYTDYLVQLTI